MARKDFDAFYEATAPGAYRLALAMSGDPYEAQDVTQIAFERIYRQWRRLSVDDPPAFVRTVVARAFFSERRRARWNRERPTADASDHMTIRDFADELSQGELLLGALRRLPPRQRQAVVLRYMEDIPVAEVASLMRCSSGTVKRSAFEGLRNLGALLDELSAES